MSDKSKKVSAAAAALFAATMAGPALTSAESAPAVMLAQAGETLNLRKMREMATRLEKGVLEAVCPAAEDIKLFPKTLIHYLADTSETSTEKATDFFTPFFPSHEADRQLFDEAVSKAFAGKPQILGVHTEGGEINAALRIEKDGSALFIFRELLSSDPLTRDDMRSANSDLARYGLPRLEDGHAGYHTTFAAEIDRNGKVRVLRNPSAVDLKAFGITGPDNFQVIPDGLSDAPSVKSFYKPDKPPVINNGVLVEVTPTRGGPAPA